MAARSGTAEALPATHTFARTLTAKNIQTVNEMQHAVAVDTIIRRHRPAIRRQRAADVALLFQDIVHLEAHSRRTFQERLRKLRVPDQLVAVHAAVRIAAAALIGDIGRKRHLPGHRDIGQRTVGESIGILVILRAQFAALCRIGNRTVHSEFKPVIAVGPVHPLAQHKFGGGILVILFRILIV